MRSRPVIVALKGVGMLASLVWGASLAWGQQQELTMEQWQQKVTECQNRKAAADAQIAELDGQIADLKTQMASSDSQYEASHKELYDLVGVTDDAQIAGFMDQLGELEQQLRGIQSLPASQIYARREEIGQIDRKLQQLRLDRLAALPEADAKIKAMEALIAQLRAVGPPPPRTDRYTVERGDNLWGISGMGRHYGDPWQWPKIFSANRDQVTDPDLIYPQWVLAIPKTFGRSQYVVAQGDHLWSIATQVYGDPGQWMRLWRANEDQIDRLGGDESVIFPYTILDVPQ
jgi:nucleoid-associated protein YgaU